MDCVYSIKLIEKALKMHFLRPGEMYVACFPASLVVKVRCMFLTAKSLAENRSPVIMFPTWAYSPSESLLENTLEFMVSSFLSFPWHFFPDRLLLCSPCCPGVELAVYALFCLPSTKIKGVCPDTWYGFLFNFPIKDIFGVSMNSLKVEAIE